MKDRAGKIGRDAVNPLLQRIQDAVPDKLKFHLVGHSFGGRLVTATVDGQNHLRVQTLLLLQAAYSHNGLAVKFDPEDSTKSGFFHAVFDNSKVSGPIVITHSKNDRAVGLAYPLASRLNGDDAAAIGDANDLFGGMVENGAQHVDTADITLLGVGGGQYDFKTSGKRVFNVNGDAIITSHGDVCPAGRSASSGNDTLEHLKTRATGSPREDVLDLPARANLSIGRLGPPKAAVAASVVPVPQKTVLAINIVN